MFRCSEPYRQRQSVKRLRSRPAQLELLEQRLPPGDILFGGALGTWWFGALASTSFNPRIASGISASRREVGQEGDGLVIHPAPFLGDRVAVSSTVGREQTTPLPAKERGLHDMPAGAPALGWLNMTNGPRGASANHVAEFSRNVAAAAPSGFTGGLTPVVVGSATEPAPLQTGDLAPSLPSAPDVRDDTSLGNAAVQLDGQRSMSGEQSAADTKSATVGSAVAPLPDTSGQLASRPLPDVFKAMPEDMRINHGKYDNRLTAAYEAWLQGQPYEQILGGGGPDGGPLDPQSNVRMSSPPFNGNQNEFQIAINPADTRFAIGTSNSGRAGGVGIYRTSDGGMTWTSQDPPFGITSCCDPAVAYGSDGVVYVGMLRFDSPQNTQVTIRSTDNGATWERVANASEPDRNNLAVDPRDSNIVYTTYSDITVGGSNRIKGYRSTDGGHTWGSSFFVGAPAPPQGYEQSSQPRVAFDGTLYVGYQQYLNSGQGCSAGVQNVLARSTDGGQTFTYTTMDIRQGGACTPGQGGRGIFCANSTGLNFRSRSHPILGINPTNSQIVYMVYSGGDLGTPYTCAGASGFHSDTLFRKSTDGGATFSDPIKINQDGLDGRDKYFPWMDVAPNGKIWVGWNDRRGDPQDFLSRWYQASSSDEGATWNEHLIGDVDVRPSGFIGDYHGLAAQNNRVLGMWYDSRVNASGDPFTDPHFGMAVAQTTPASNEIITDQRTQYVVRFSDPYDPTSVSASALTVNQIPADSVEMTSADTLTFTYQVSPITQQGLQTMAMDAGAVTRLDDGEPLQAFSSNFRYAVARLAVDDSTPPDGATVPIPFTTLDLHFSVPFDPATIRTSNLTPSQGRVTGATPLDDQTVEYTFDGVTFVDTFTVRMAAGAVTDRFGNPGLPYSGAFNLDLVEIPFPTPVASRSPLGSLVYETSAVGFINPVGDTDGFTALIDPRQTITLDVTPTAPAMLQPQVDLYVERPDGQRQLMGSAAADGPGREAVLQTVPTADNLTTPPTPLTYVAVVSGASDTTGRFQIRLTLNAALEGEEHGGPPSTSIDTAQDLDPAFQALLRGRDAPTRAAVLGRTNPGPNYSATPVPYTFEDISTTGHPVLHGVDDDFVQIPASQLGGFTFPFFDHTYDTLFVNSNALITFGSGTTAYNNTDLTNSPSQACIADLWQDLVTYDPPSFVYWEVRGSGSDQRLIIQFDHMRYIGQGTPTLTFETVLYTDGSFQFNFNNLNGGVPALDEGRHGTVGLKDAGNQGPNRLLVSFNNGPNEFVGSQKSTRINPPVAPTADYYSFSLQAGQSATLAVKALTSSGETLELRDSSDNVLATGTSGSTNVDQVISDFVAPATGTYYARLGGPVVDYNLVITRDADFDTDPNHDFTTAQALASSPVNGRQYALGYVTRQANGHDFYQIAAAEGQVLQLETFTPADLGGVFGNVLDPLLRVYDANQNLVAFDEHSANDGRNARITYAIPAGGGGTYYIEISPSEDTPETRGEYVLEVAGAGAGNRPGPSGFAVPVAQNALPVPFVRPIAQALVMVGYSDSGAIADLFPVNAPVIPSPNPTVELTPLPLDPRRVDQLFTSAEGMAFLAGTERVGEGASSLEWDI
jgi:hypothetical protein